jgi:hypothetical protein
MLSRQINHVAYSRMVRTLYRTLPVLPLLRWFGSPDDDSLSESESAWRVNAWPE